MTLRISWFCLHSCATCAAFCVLRKIRLGYLSVGRVIAAITMLCGILVIALPITILGGQIPFTSICPPEKHIPSTRTCSCVRICVCVCVLCLCTGNFSDAYSMHQQKDRGQIDERYAGTQLEVDWSKHKHCYTHSSSAQRDV